MQVKFPLAMVACVALAGCTTVTRGTNDVLVVESTPSGAQVKISGGATCDSTPCSFKLPRKSELYVVVSKVGCTAQQVRVTNRVANAGGAAMAGNLLLGGFIGAGVDASSGAMLELVPNPVKVTLRCRGG